MNEPWSERRPAAQDAREYAYEAIKQNILNMSLVPGDQLSEAAMAERLNVSRTPVHDAFARLVQEGLVYALPQRGTIVAPLSAERIEQGAFMQLHLGRAVADRLDRAGLPEELMFFLESSVNRQFYTLGSGRYGALDEMDAQFHAALYAACGLPLVWRSLSVACADIARMMAVTLDPDAWHDLVYEHSELVGALRRRDDEAAGAILERHFGHTLDWLVAARMRFPSYFSLPEGIPAPPDEKSLAADGADLLE